MQRILVFGMTENPGGVESFLMNYYRHLNRANLQFDFLCNFHNPMAFEDEAKNLGARVFHITPRRQNRIVFYRELEGLFKIHAYEWAVIWVNVNSLANIDYLKAAKKYGIRKRIIHSHSSQNMDGKLRGKLHELNRCIIDRYATDYWACSEEAARWFYRDCLLSNAIIIPNAIDPSRMAFDGEARKIIRNQLECYEDDMLVGNVGRLNFEKNQSFALEVMHEYLKSEANAKLVLVGKGEDEPLLKEKAKALEIENNVIFAGAQNNIRDWMSAFDVFFFPSLFEGFGIVTLEAQANGLPVLLSAEAMPVNLQINHNVCVMKLHSSTADWAKALQKTKELGRVSSDETIARFRQAGYDIAVEAKKLEAMLMEK